MTQPRQGIGTTIVLVAVATVLVAVTMAFVVLSSQTSTPPSSLTTYTVSNGLADGTFEYPNIPANLTLGTFSFHMVYNGTGYSANGTVYMGFEVVFNVTNQTQSQVVIFQWGPYGPTSNLPSPTTATIYGGAVTINWTATSSAYPYVTGPAAFLNILVKTPSG